MEVICEFTCVCGLLFILSFLVFLALFSSMRGGRAGYGVKSTYMYSANEEAIPKFEYMEDNSWCFVSFIFHSLISLLRGILLVALVGLPSFSRLVGDGIWAWADLDRSAYSICSSPIACTPTFLPTWCACQKRCGRWYFFHDFPLPFPPPSIQCTYNRAG